MPPRTRPSSSTSRQSSQPNIDPNLFGALSIADLRALCLQHGIPSTGARKTLERRLRGLNTPSRGVENIHEPSGPTWSSNNNETAAQRQDFTDDQMRTIQQLIKDTVHNQKHNFKAKGKPRNSWSLKEKKRRQQHGKDESGKNSTEIRL